MEEIEERANPIEGGTAVQQNDISRGATAVPGQDTGRNLMLGSNNTQHQTVQNRTLEEGGNPAAPVNGGTGLLNGLLPGLGGTAPEFVERFDRYTEVELRAADSKLQDLAAADRKLIEIFGDTIHQNDGTHLHGTVSSAVDQMWQRRWLRVTSGPQNLYYLPRGAVGHRFLNLLVKECGGARERKWNSERPLCLLACIMHKLRGVKKGAGEIKQII